MFFIWYFYFAAMIVSLCCHNLCRHCCHSGIWCKISSPFLYHWRHTAICSAEYIVLTLLSFMSPNSCRKSNQISIQLFKVFVSLFNYLDTLFLWMAQQWLFLFQVWLLFIFFLCIVENEPHLPDVRFQVFNSIAL